MLLSTSFVSYSYGKNSVAVHDPMVRNITKLDETILAPLCYSFIGYGCSDCFGIGKQCIENKCVCDQGCAGADGNCWPEGNIQINANPVKVSNRWSKLNLNLPKFAPMQQMRVAAKFFFGNGLLGEFAFNIYQLPGGGFNSEHKRYFLSLDAEPNKVVTVKEAIGVTASVSKATNDLVRKWIFYAVDLANHERAQDLSLRICNMRGLLGFDAIKIGRTLQNGHNLWAQVRFPPVFVYGWDTQAMNQDPGDKGYWLLDDDTLYDQFEMCEA